MRGGIFTRERDKSLELSQMTERDIDDVREVGQIAWSDLATHDIGRKFRYPKRSGKIIEAYLATEPGGCIVAKEGGKVIGSGFAHVWGKVGWIGPLEVLPDHQGAGVGKSLLAECERYLERRGCEVYGLETMSHLPKQIHFYMSSGYTPRNLTLIVEKVLRHEQEEVLAVEDAKVNDLPEALPELAELSAAFNPWLDYSPEAESIVTRRLGNMFICRRDGEMVGAALLHTYQRGDEASFSSIKALLVRPGVPGQNEIFDSLLYRCERTSLEQGKNRLLGRFSTEHAELYDLMLRRSYELKGANVRMVKKGTYVERSGLNITSWAG